MRSRTGSAPPPRARNRLTGRQQVPLQQREEPEHERDAGSEELAGLSGTERWIAARESRTGVDLT